MTTGTDAANDAGDNREGEIAGIAQRQAGPCHQREAGQADGLVADVLAEQAGGERHDDAGQKISAEQHADLGVADGKIVHQRLADEPID
jgi:hypothetical protein